jgi:hypothetical protein
MSPSRPQSRSARPEHEQVVTPSAGRDTKGRFTKGNPGGPGNPFARQVAKLRSALVTTVTEADMQGIAQALIAQAQRGNLAATRLVFLYVLGKPTETVNPDTLDLEEGQPIVQPIPPIVKELPEVLVSLPVETADELVGITQQAVDDALALLQQAFEKVVNAITTNEPKGQESAEEEWRAALPDEGAPSTNGEREPAETLAGPSTNGRFGWVRSLLWLAKIAATARLASERTRTAPRRLND